MKHLDKVQAAINYIERHLSRKLDLDEIAGAVHYSKYHLHRIFTKVTGLTIHEYLQRRQLTEAARLLAFSDKPIAEIALLAGYESQQAFTMAFGAMYKLSPRQFRERELFYPLQLRFELEGQFAALEESGALAGRIRPATMEDIAGWMALTRLVVDGYPCLNEQQHMDALRQDIRRQQAFVLEDGGAVVGVMQFSRRTGSIGFLGVHPLYRERGIAKAFLDKALRELPAGAEAVSITTYREGDRADTGHRESLKKLGFAEAGLLVEFGYPTQRFVLPARVRGCAHHA